MSGEATVTEGGGVFFVLKMTHSELVPESREYNVGYSFPVTGPGPFGTAMPSPTPQPGVPADHYGPAAGSSVRIAVEANAPHGEMYVSVSTIMDSVGEGPETIVLLVTSVDNGGSAGSPPAQATATITDYTPYTPPGGSYPPTTPPPTTTNGPPTVSDGTATVDELANGTATVTGSYSDPDGDTVNVNAVVPDGWGSFAAAADGTWTWTFPKSDGPRSTSLAISAYDNRGGTAGVTAYATVVNVAPYDLELSVSPAATDEGGTVSLTGYFRDPGADTFTVDLLWADGSPVQPVYLGSARTFSLTHIYKDDDPTNTSWDNYRIHATVTDDDGGESNDATATARVNNVDPSNVTARATNPIVEGGRAIVEAGDATHPFKGDGSFDDPGTQDTWSTSTVNYGDGTPEVALVIKAGQKFDIPPHVYAEPDVYTATVKVRDDDGGAAATKEISVTVVRLVALRAEEHASGGAAVEVDNGTAKDMYVAERRATGDAEIRLFELTLPVATPHGRILYAVSGNDAAPASGNFAVPPTDVKLTPTGGNRAYTVKAGFDNNGNGTLDSGEADRTINVYVVRVDMVIRNMFLPLLQDNTYMTPVFSGGPAPVTGYRVEISRIGRADWYLFGTSAQFTRRARVAGWFDVCSFATIAGRKFESNTVAFRGAVPDLRRDCRRRGRVGRDGRRVGEHAGGDGCDLAARGGVLHLLEHGRRTLRGRSNHSRPDGRQQHGRVGNAGPTARGQHR